MTWFIYAAIVVIALAMIAMILAFIFIFAQSLRMFGGTNTERPRTRP
jgi:hypothetical protein